MIGFFPYIRLLEWVTGGSNIPTGFVAKFRIPHTVTGQYRVIVYMTVFGEVTIPWVGGGQIQSAGINFQYSILPDYMRYGQSDPNDYAFPNNPQWGNLVDNVITPTARSVDIPFGLYDPTQPGGYEIYNAYDPMLIHNNNAEPGGDVQRKVMQVLGDPFPNATESPDYQSVSMGDLIAIKVSRAAITGGGSPYTGKIGFINLRWQLVAV